MKAFFLLCLLAIGSSFQEPLRRPSLLSRLDDDLINEMMIMEENWIIWTYRDPFFSPYGRLFALKEYLVDDRVHKEAMPRLMDKLKYHFTENWLYERNETFAHRRNVSVWEEEREARDNCFVVLQNYTNRFARPWITSIRDHKLHPAFENYTFYPFCSYMQMSDVDNILRRAEEVYKLTKRDRSYDKDWKNLERASKGASDEQFMSTDGGHLDESFNREDAIKEVSMKVSKLYGYLFNQESQRFEDEVHSFYEQIPDSTINELRHSLRLAFDDFLKSKTFMSYPLTTAWLEACEEPFVTLLIEHYEFWLDRIVELLKEPYVPAGEEKARFFINAGSRKYTNIYFKLTNINDLRMAYDRVKELRDKSVIGPSYHVDHVCPFEETLESVPLE